MPRIQIDIPKELNKKLKIYKARKEFQNLQITVIESLTKFFEDTPDGS